MDNEEPPFEAMKKMFEYIEICSEPVYTLAECLSATPDDGGFDLEEDRIADIKERFRAFLYLSDEELLDSVRFVAALSTSRAPLEKTLHFEPYLFLYNDFVFVFLYGGKYHLVLPVELAGIFHEVISAEDFEALHTVKLELKMYATALLNLYGAYETEQFINVWNHHHKNKISYDEAETFLSAMEYSGPDCYFNEGIILHESLFGDEIDDLFDSVHGKAYYMPAKSLIREYAAKEKDMDVKIPAKREMDDFLAGIVPKENDLAWLQWAIENSCERLMSPAEVRQTLEEADFPLDDETAVGQFERLYNRLRDNTHIWELRGFTPWLYASETGEMLKAFKLPKRKKKHGRNTNPNL